MKCEAIDRKEQYKKIFEEIEKKLIKFTNIFSIMKKDYNKIKKKWNQK